ncbi:MAG: hypothetical protein HY863_10935 [Chloroflexi bacterium]|nr:hypothetical protein [Chloroflexota bacterium]
MTANQKIDKDKFEAAMRIAEFCIRQFNERRDYSWKISLGFWAVIIGSVAVVKEYFQTFPDNLCLRIFISILVLIVGGSTVCLHRYWLKSVAKADKFDKDLAFEARDRAINYAHLKLINVPPPKYKTSEDYKDEEDWSFKFQYLATLMLVVIVEIVFFCFMFLYEKPL